MGKYILKRIIQIIPIVIGVSFIVYIILSLTPGDPARIILGQSATPEEVEMLREQLNLNDNLIVRYVKYMFNVMKGDLGRSYTANAAVVDLIKGSLPNTMKVGFISLLVTVLISIPLSIFTAVKQNTFFDDFMRFFTLILAGMPQFWLGIILIIFFSVKLDLLPSYGLDSVQSYFMPVLCNCAAAIAINTRIGRASILDVIRQDFIITARAKGLPEATILRKHVLKTASLPIITSISMFIPIIFAGSVIVESIFSINGIGLLMVSHIRQKDIPTVLGCILLITVVITVTNLIADLAYGLVDPRIKAKYAVQKRVVGK